MTTSAAALAASTSAVTAAVPSVFLQECVRQQLGLPHVADVSEIEPPRTGRLRLWHPSWDVGQILDAAERQGLRVQESIHVRQKDFSRVTLTAGYLTVAEIPPTNGGGKYRKPGNLKQCEVHANLAETLMTVLVCYACNLDLYCKDIWLITASKCGDKYACVYVGEETIIIELHPPAQIMHNTHGTTVKYVC